MFISIFVDVYLLNTRYPNNQLLEPEKVTDYPEFYSLPSTNTHASTLLLGLELAIDLLPPGRILYTMIFWNYII